MYRCEAANLHTSPTFFPLNQSCYCFSISQKKSTSLPLLLLHFNKPTAARQRRKPLYIRSLNVSHMSPCSTLCSSLYINQLVTIRLKFLSCISAPHEEKPLDWHSDLPSVVFKEKIHHCRLQLRSTAMYRTTSRCSHIHNYEHFTGK